MDRVLLSKEGYPLHAMLGMQIMSTATLLLPYIGLRRSALVLWNFNMTLLALSASRKLIMRFGLAKFSSVSLHALGWSIRSDFLPKDQPDHHAVLTSFCKIGWISCDNASNNTSMMTELAHWVEKITGQSFIAEQQRIRPVPLLCLLHI